jgi:hypothetical protein
MKLCISIRLALIWALAGIEYKVLAGFGNSMLIQLPPPDTRRVYM